MPFPWAHVLHNGLCLLRLPPDVFWAMTPVEFHAVAGGLAPQMGGVSRIELDGMMQRFPDAAPPL